MSDLLKRAADSTACSMLNDIGSAGTQLAVWTMWTPKVALVPLTVGALGYMANNLLCPQQTIDDFPAPSPDIEGCKKVKDGYGELQYKPGGSDLWFGNTQNVTEIVQVFPYFSTVDSFIRLVVVRTTDDTEDQTIEISFSTRDAAIGAKFRIDVAEGTCAIEGGDQDPGNPDPGFDPYPWTDTETNCNYTLKLEGFAQLYKDGPAQPVWNIQSAGETVRSSGGTARNSGGVMGGCNLSPTIYIGGNGDGPGGPNGPPSIPVPTPIPGPDPDGVPWWVPALAGAAGGALLNQILESIKDLSKPTFNEGSFTLTAPCDVDEDGNQLTRTWEFLEGSFEERMNAQQVALMEILQQHLNWKTPTCNSREKPTLAGDWISTRWVSDSPSPGSKQHLRKLFRYRSKSTRTNDQLQTYWSTFIWQAGPVCVIHKGAWWGTPQVWAASADEGKRVIRFAAGEAGIDPDQVGEWHASSSRSARYGMSGRMRLAEEQGEQWVTRREGASGLPEL